LPEDQIFLLNKTDRGSPNRSSEAGQRLEIKWGETGGKRVAGLRNWACKKEVQNRKNGTEKPSRAQVEFPPAPKGSKNW